MPKINFLTITHLFYYFALVDFDEGFKPNKFIQKYFKTIMYTLALLAAVSVLVTSVNILSKPEVDPIICVLWFYQFLLAFSFFIGTFRKNIIGLQFILMHLLLFRFAMIFWMTSLTAMIVSLSIITCCEIFVLNGPKPYFPDEFRGIPVELAIVVHLSLMILSFFFKFLLTLIEIYYRDFEAILDQPSSLQTTELATLNSGGKSNQVNNGDALYHTLA